MATKKTDTTTPHDDFKAMPSDMPSADPQAAEPKLVVPEAPVPDMQVTQTTTKVTGYRELSADEVRRINAVKDNFNSTIEHLKTLRDAYHDADTQRMFAFAITNAETASMWAVRTIAHRW
jgi:hypothetical protein